VPLLRPRVEQAFLSSGQPFAATSWDFVRRSLDGFADAWTKELGAAVATELGVTLTPTSMKVIEFARADFKEQGQTPGLRRITARTGVGTKELYELFPKGPVKLIARIAGTPKPKSCL